jgi:hypothetical protein
MTGSEHYQAAEQLLAEAVTPTPSQPPAVLIAAAGVHVQLADLAHRVGSGITWMAPKASQLVSAWADAVGPESHTS